MRKILILTSNGSCSVDLGASVCKQHSSLHLLLQASSACWAKGVLLNLLPFLVPPPNFPLSDFYFPLTHLNLFLLSFVVHSYLIAVHWSNFPLIAVWSSTELSSSNPAAQHHTGLEKKLSAVIAGKIWPHPCHSRLQCAASACWLNLSHPVTPRSFEEMEAAWQFSLCSPLSIWQLSRLFCTHMHSQFWRVNTVKYVEENTLNLWTNFSLGSLLQRMQ